MKNLLTIVVCHSDNNDIATCDGVEFIFPEEGENEKNFLTRAFKQAKGKYSLVCENTLKLADVQSVLNILDKNTADIVCFVGGAVFRTAIMKNAVKDCEDAFSCRVLALLECKNLLKTVYNPFIFVKRAKDFTEENTEGILLAAAEFKKAKAKLTKEIYSFAFDMLCSKLVTYYLYSMLAIKDGSMPAEKLIEFDNKLKAEIVLYLALDKRFTYAKLQKLRDKGFKISSLTARKFKKCLKI